MEPVEPKKLPAPPAKRSDLGGLAHGLQFALTAILGLAAGRWLEQKGMLPAPVGTLGGLLIGAVLGMYVLARSLK